MIANLRSFEFFYQEKSIEKSIENMDTDARVLSFPFSHEIRSVKKTGFI